MDEIRIEDREIVKEANRIRYWRRVRMVKLSIAIGLVLAIAYFAWVNYSYANDIRLARSEYGQLWSCYVCGYENLRSCACISSPTVKIDEDFKINLGKNNINDCIDYSSAIKLES